MAKVSKCIRKKICLTLNMLKFHILKMASKKFNVLSNDENVPRSVNFKFF